MHMLGEMKKLLAGYVQRMIFIHYLCHIAKSLNICEILLNQQIRQGTLQKKIQSSGKRNKG